MGLWRSGLFRPEFPAQVERSVGILRDGAISVLPHRSCLSRRGLLVHLPAGDVRGWVGRVLDSFAIISGHIAFAWLLGSISTDSKSRVAFDGSVVICGPRRFAVGCFRGPLRSRTRHTRWRDRVFWGSRRPIFSDVRVVCVLEQTARGPRWAGVVWV